MISPRLKQARASYTLRFPTAVEIASLNGADFCYEKPKVSLIIPVHNHLELTTVCLASLLLQHGENNFEVIVVDDASSDGSFEFLSGIEGLRLLRMPSQSGYVLASNKGAELARTDMLVFLNNDTIVQADWLDGHLWRLGLYRSRRSHCPTSTEGKRVYPGQSVSPSRLE